MNPLGSWFATYPPGHQHSGQPITRESRCECGKVFSQSLLSAKQCEAWEARGIMGLVLRQIPDLYVPVHCPKCERRDLAHQARIDETKTYHRSAA